MVAFLDDRVGRRHGRERGVVVTGTLELLCQGIRDNMLGEPEAEDIVNVLADHEAFLPCNGSTFLEWARAEGFLS
jgi:predicted nucleic acid-binding protein